MKRLTPVWLLVAAPCACAPAPSNDPSGPPETNFDHSIATECATPKLRAIFSATAADIAAADPDGSAGDPTRTSAFEADFSIGCGSNEITEYATSRVKATLRSAEGSVVEQWLLNDPRASHTLNTYGCTPQAPYPQCWLFVPDDLDDEGHLDAALPTWSAEAAAILDPQGTKPTVGGSVRLDLGNLTTDPVSGGATFRWDAPLGLEQARIQLRLDRLVGEDGAVLIEDFALYRERWVGDGPDVQSAVVTVESRTDHELILSVDVRALADAVVAGKDDDGCIFTIRELRIEGTTVRWTFTNQGLDDATIDNIQVGWPASQGSLLEARIDGAVLWQGVREPPTVTFSDGWEAIDDERTVEPGEDVSVELVFEKVPDTGWNPSDLRIDVGFLEGCATKLAPATLDPGDVTIL